MTLPRTINLDDLLYVHSEDWVAVYYQGKLVTQGDNDALFEAILPKLMGHILPRGGWFPETTDELYAQGAEREAIEAEIMAARERISKLEAQIKEWEGK